MLIDSDGVRTFFMNEFDLNGSFTPYEILQRFDQYVEKRGQVMEEIEQTAPAADVSSETSPLPHGGTHVKVYTDGSCSGNPGPGGWGAAFFVNDTEVEGLYGSERRTTNNRMELMGAISALRAAHAYDKVEIVTDSQYVRKGITEWIKGWKRNNWKTAAKKPVKNDDLWKLLDEEATRAGVTWKWVKGHSGDPGNERADELANKGTEEARR
jgi:ribonuclease HI